MTDLDDIRERFVAFQALPKRGRVVPPQWADIDLLLAEIDRRDTILRKINDEMGPVHRLVNVALPGRYTSEEIALMKGLFGDV